VLQGKIYVSPDFSEQLIFKVIQSGNAGTASPLDLLSNRELEVLQLLGKGASTCSIAETLHLSAKTIETHRTHIKEKLRFRESEEMVKSGLDLRDATVASPRVIVAGIYYNYSIGRCCEQIARQIRNILLWDRYNNDFSESSRFLN